MNTIADVLTNLMELLACMGGVAVVLFVIGSAFLAGSSK